MKLTYDFVQKKMIEGRNMTFGNNKFVRDSEPLPSKALWLDRETLDRWLYVSSTETLERMNSLYAKLKEETPLTGSQNTQMQCSILQVSRVLGHFASNLKRKYPNSAIVQQLTLEELR